MRTPMEIHLGVQTACCRALVTSASTQRAVTLTLCVSGLQVDLLWTPHNCASVCALRAQIPAHAACCHAVGAPPAAEQGWNNLNGFEDVRTENGSSKGQNLALTGLLVPSSRG